MNTNAYAIEELEGITNQLARSIERRHAALMRDKARLGALNRALRALHKENQA